jgi:hypothetical protein
MFTRNWQAKLDVCIKAIPVPRYVLSLYAPVKLESTPIQQIDPVHWHGAHAMFFPVSTVVDVCMWMDNEVAKGVAGLEPGQSIRRFCEATGTPLFVCNPNLVQHKLPAYKSPTFQL